MSAPNPAADAIAAFTRRLAVAAFVDGLARALFVVAMSLVVVLLGARFVGWRLEPQWSWLAGLVPVVVFAQWQVVRRRLSPAAVAAHVDRRLGTHGLLLSAHDGVAIDAEWRARLAVAVQELPRALPRMSWRELWWRPSVAAALLAAVCLLPGIDDGPGGPQVAASAALQRLDEQLRALEQRGALPADIDQELQRRLRDLEQRIQDGDPSVWRELDEMGQKLDRERLLQAAQQSPSPAARDAESLSATQLARAAELLAKTGRLDDLAAAAKDALQQAALGNGTFDASLLPSDPATLRKLAEAIAQAGLELDPGQLLGSISPEQMAELLRLAQGLARSLGEADLRFAMDLARQLGAGPRGSGSPAPGQPGGAAGSGATTDGAAGREGAASGAGGEPGVSSGSPARGPGRAALQLTAQTTGTAEQPFELPAGDVQPGQWQPSDPLRSDPEVQPTSNRAPGGHGVAGTGGATWQLRLAPRHRAVVQRFFDTANGGGK